MKVLFLTPELLPNWGGNGTYYIELAKALNRIIEIHVATVERLENRKPIYSQEDMRRYFDDRVDIHTLAKAPMEDTFFYNATFQLSVWRKLKAILKENDIDLVHSNLPAMPDLLTKFWINNPVPSVATLHTTIEGHKQGLKATNLGFLQMEFSEKCTLAFYPLIKLAEHIYLRKTTELITVSEWMKRVIFDTFPFLLNARTNVEVVYNGVDEKRFSPEKAKHCEILSECVNPIVLFSSRFTTMKGIHYLISAIPKILRENREVHFVFTGAGETEPWIRLLKELGVPESLYTFLGYVDYNLLPSIYAKADIFVAPTLYDNFPFRVLEAMSSRTAVVASNICGIPEMITNGKNGILVPAADWNHLAEALLLLLDDQKMRRKLARGGRQTIIERFTWKTISKRLFKVYERILSRFN